MSQSLLSEKEGAGEGEGEREKLFVSLMSSTLLHLLTKYLGVKFGFSMLRII